MTSKPRGLALIINNTRFFENPEEFRTGGKEDTSYMLKLFESMDYDCETQPNVTRDVSYAVKTNSF